MRKGNRFLHVLIVVAVFAIGLGAFHAVGAVTSNTSPKPDLVVSLDEPGRQEFTCQFSLNGPDPRACNVPTGSRLVIQAINWYGPCIEHVVSIGSGRGQQNFTAQAPCITDRVFGHALTTMYVDGASGGFLVRSSATGSTVGTITGFLLNCNRILAGTNAITADCNSTDQNAHAIPA